MPRVKVTVVGGPRVGKSALAVRFLTRRFIGEYHDMNCKYIRERSQHRIVLIDISGS